MSGGVEMESFGFDHIKVFLSVVEAGSFSAAARHLDRAQATISYTIGNLERALDVRLFDRSGHKPQLTEAGQALLGPARAVHFESSRLQAAARSFAEGHEPRLAVAVDSATPTGPLVEILGRLGAAFSGVAFELQIANRGEVAGKVLSGACALGLSGPLVEIPGALTVEPLCAVAVCAVAAPGHPLAAMSGAVPVGVLRGHTRIALPEGDLDDGEDRGVVADRVWTACDLGASRALLLGGLGWGVVPLHLIEGDLEQGRLVRLAVAGWPEGDAASPRALIFRREDPPGPAGRWLIEQLRSAYSPHDAS